MDEYPAVGCELLSRARDYTLKSPTLRTRERLEAHT